MQKTISGKNARFRAKAILNIIWDHFYEPKTGLARQPDTAKYFHTVTPELVCLACCMLHCAIKGPKEQLTIKTWKRNYTESNVRKKSGV